MSDYDLYMNWLREHLKDLGPEERAVALDFCADFLAEEHREAIEDQNLAVPRTREGA